MTLLLFYINALSSSSYFSYEINYKTLFWVSIKLKSPLRFLACCSFILVDFTIMRIKKISLCIVYDLTSGVILWRLLLWKKIQFNNDMWCYAYNAFKSMQSMKLIFNWNKILSNNTNWRCLFINHLRALESHSQLFI